MLVTLHDKVAGVHQVFRRKKTDDEALHCPLCSLENPLDADTCSRCYYDFTVSSHQQSRKSDEQVVGGLLDELTSGIEEGGKTGLTAVTVGILMLSGLFLAGLFKAIPQYAAACALVAIGAMMMRQAADIDWANKEMALPAFLTIVMMPFTYSIAIGIAWGVLSYVLIKIGMQKFDEVSKVMYGLAAFLLMYYIGPGDGNTFQWIFGLF